MLEKIELTGDLEGVAGGDWLVEDFLEEAEVLEQDRG
jgi:hypothetical protein